MDTGSQLSEAPRAASVMDSEEGQKEFDEVDVGKWREEADLHLEHQRTEIQGSVARKEVDILQQPISHILEPDSPRQRPGVMPGESNPSLKATSPVLKANGREVAFKRLTDASSTDDATLALEEQLRHTLTNQERTPLQQRYIKNGRKEGKPLSGQRAASEQRLREVRLA